MSLQQEKGHILIKQAELSAFDQILSHASLAQTGHLYSICLGKIFVYLTVYLS